MSESKHTAICPGCEKSHDINQDDWNLFGVDCWCMKCIEWDHIDFMRINAERLGLTCVENCRCGFCNPA